MFPLISLLQDGEMMEMGMEGAEAMAGAMDAADMTAMGEYIYMFVFKEKRYEVIYIKNWVIVSHNIYLFIVKNISQIIKSYHTSKKGPNYW